MTTLRAGERASDRPLPPDAWLAFVGVIHTPWKSRAECPRQGAPDGPECRIDVFPPWAGALEGIAAGDRVEVLYWLHEARRDLILQMPSHATAPVGTFALRSPMRPNPIGSSRVDVVGCEPAALVVRGLDCLDGTPLLDLKPERCARSPTPAHARG